MTNPLPYHYHIYRTDILYFGQIVFTLQIRIPSL